MLCDHDADDHSNWRDEGQDGHVEEDVDAPGIAGDHVDPDAEDHWNAVDRNGGEQHPDIRLL